MRWIIGLGLAAAASIVGFAFLVWIALAQAASVVSRVAAPLLESARASVEASLPPELAPDEVRHHLDEAVVRLRDGRVDGAALRDAIAWLPGALLDGAFDEAESAILWEKLRRIAPREGSAEGP